MRVLFRACLAAWALGLMTGASALRAQTPPVFPALGSKPPGFQALQLFLQKQLSQPQYQHLAVGEKMGVAAMALAASMVIDSGRCANRSVMDGAAWSAALALSVVDRQSGRGLTGFPAPTRAQLIDLAMSLESLRQPEQDLAPALCRGAFLPDPEVMPLSERRLAAKKMLTILLSEPKATRTEHP